MLPRLRLLSAALLLSAIAIGCADPGAASSDGDSTSAQTGASPKAAVSNLQKASDKKDATDKRLGSALGRVGGVLSPTESAAFTKSWNALPDVVAAHTDYQTKAQTLATTLAAVAASPARIQSFGPKNLVAGYALLAKTPQALAALEFGTDAVAHRVVLPGVKDADIVEQIIGPSLAGAYFQKLLETGTVAGANAAISAVLSKGEQSSIAIAGWIEGYNAFAEVDVTRKLTGISSASTCDGLRTIAGMIAIWTVGSDLAEGKRQEALTEFLNSGGDAVDGLASAASLFRRIVMGVDETPLAATVMKWSDTIATGVTGVMSAIALWNDSGKWNDSPAAKAQVAADVVGIAASIACLALTGPVGPALTGLAVGLTALSSWLEARQASAQELADLKACLPATGMAPTLAQTVIDGDRNLIANIVNTGGLAPDDVKWVLTIDPNLVSADIAMGMSCAGLGGARKIFSLDAGKTAALLKAAVGDATGADATQRLDVFMRGLDFGAGWNGDLSTSDALAWLAQEEADPTVDANQAPYKTAAFTGAHDYLAAQP